MEYYYWSLVIISIGIFFDTLSSIVNYKKYYSQVGIFSLGNLIELNGKGVSNKILNFVSPFLNNKMFKYILIVRLIIALLLIFIPNSTYFLVFGLFILQLLFNLRNRPGLSGADQMRTILLFGLSIMSVNDKFYFGIGLLFIVLQVYLSYFFAGYNKAKSPIWRKGNALIWVLNSDLFGNRNIQNFLINRGKLFNKVSCWMVIIFQLGFFLFASIDNSVLYIFAIGIVFHLSLALISNLNDFFWTYISSYPLVYFFATEFHFYEYFNY